MSNFYLDSIADNLELETTDRRHDILLLEPTTRSIVTQIINEAKAQGLDLMVFETYRSKARQEQLYAKGASGLKNVGVHHYGLACDLVKSINGEPSWKGDFSLIGQLAKPHGLLWGGDWGNPDKAHKLVDVYHVQRCSLARQPELFAGTWYPQDDYNPCND
jgi:hypothetical protein